MGASSWDKDLRVLLLLLLLRNQSGKRREVGRVFGFGRWIGIGMDVWERDGEWIR